ncbi:MAG: polysaccharide biosynthesis/export family protein [Alphaproteobacteria bacterium]|nr:polysaccharide biosynthesis/export family protein [Alphaproteobacteria bacterium]
MLKNAHWLSKMGFLKLGLLFAALLFLGYAPAKASDPSDYVLGIGDKLRITVYGETDLSGEFEVSSTGMVSMPLIGETKAMGTTIAKLKDSITAKLKDGYLKDPKVSMEVMNYRPFFIVGEVMKPGSYNYQNGMTVINAVALAGGYTYRADKDDIKVKRGGQNGKEEKVKEDTTVGAGDVVTVPERFF